jgi:PAS domain S-box-containing protein
MAALILLWLHIPGIACFALLRGFSLGHALFEVLIVTVAAVVASGRTRSRKLRSLAATFGLLSSSAVLTHLSGGLIEMHFHFFVMIAIIAMYQDWTVFLLAVGYVFVHHGLLGALDPESVFNHPAALANPWKWAAIHGGFILSASVVSMIAWRVGEAARARADLILASAGEGIYGLDREGRTTFINRAAARMIGWEPDEIIGRNQHTVLHHSRADGTSYPRDECPIYAAFKDGAVHRRANEVFWRKDGSSFPVEYISTPIVDRGRTLGAVVTFQDITERTKAQHELERALEKEQEAAERLRDLDGMKNAFLEAVSHELRTPLAAVLGFALTLQRDDIQLSQEERAEFVGRLATNARKLNRLLGDLLDVDRLARGIIEPRYQSTDVLALVSRVVEETNVGDHSVKMEGDPIVVVIDPAKTERIVENLLVNAAKYTPSGTPIEVWFESDGAGLLIAVDDEGPGVPDDLKETIFEPFRRGREIQPHAPGAGIGLSLVARFAELQGGRAWVENRPGGGASFRVLIRLDGKDDEESAEPALFRDAG